MGAFESKYWKKPLGRHIVVVDNGRHSTLRRCRTCIHQVRKEHSVVEDGFFDSGADSIVNPGICHARGKTAGLQGQNIL